MLDLYLEEKYPAGVNLRDDSVAILRPVQQNDFERLMQFWKHIPAKEKLYLKNDVSNPHVIRGMLEKMDYWEHLPIVAETENRFIGYAALYQTQHGWMRSIGNIRIIVSPDKRSLGLGEILVQEIIAAASYSGLEKIMLEMVGEQESEAFQKLGFSLEARIKDHVKDLSGNHHDYIIMVYHILDPEEEIPGR